MLPDFLGAEESGPVLIAKFLGGLLVMMAAVMMPTVMMLAMMPKSHVCAALPTKCSL